MKRFSLSFVWFLMGLLLVPDLVQSQEKPLDEEEDYILAAGDTIQIFIYNEESQPPPLRINPKGSIMVPLIGSVKIAGLTMSEAKELLEQKLSKFHKFPEVEVNLVEQGPQRERIYALGAFEKPGLLAYQLGMNVLDVIAAASGLRPDADSAHASITRGTESLPVDLQRLLKGDLSQNLEMKPNDVLDVPRGDFYVIGAVKTPGRFPITPETRVLEAVTAAGGFTEEAALREAIIFRRDGQNVPVDLWGMLKKGSILNNVPLYSGDILFLPESDPSGGVMVLGEVMQPGLYPYEPGETLIGVLQKRGLKLGEGPGEPSGWESAEVSLIRVGEDARAISLKRLIQEGDLSLNVPIQAGDTLIVRRRFHKISLLGRVTRPGTYLVPGTATLLEVLPQAGGLADGADLRRVSILRGQERLVRDIQALVNQGQLDQNLDLQDGDIVVVPEAGASRQVLVVGEVQKPGPHVLQDKENLMQAIALAGGMPARGRYEAQITRGESQLLQADLWALLKKGDTSQNLPVEEGDIIVVRPQEVFVLGWVQKPGKYPLGERGILADALADAGGPIPERANLRGIRIIRVDEQIKANLLGLYTQGDLTQNISLQANDVIVVPQIDAQEGILVLGQVGQPGLHVMAEGEDLLTALAVSGGIQVKEGRPVAQITRGEETLQSDLLRLIELGDLKQNQPLQPGDVIIVRGVPEEITVVGEVERPGTYALRQRARLLDGLGVAGGILERADLHRIVLLRGEERRIIDLEQILKGKDVKPEDLAQNLALESGDVVVVPRREKDEVLVVGEVSQPGAYPYVEDMRLLQALGLAKGFLTTADLKQTTIIRGEDRLPIDFDKFLKEGDKSQNVLLEGGDVVLVPNLREANILVFGKVEKPGSYPPVEGMTLVDLLSTASLLPLADPNRISIFRGEEILNVDFQAVLDKGDQSQNPKLQRGDRILVPERERFFLFGAVAQPGMLPVKKDLKLAEIVGYMRPDADVGGVRILRPNPQGGKPEILRPNLQRLVKYADETQNLAIQAGDFVYVPYRSNKVEWYKNPNNLWYAISTFNLIDRTFF